MASSETSTMRQQKNAETTHLIQEGRENLFGRVDRPLSGRKLYDSSGNNVTDEGSENERFISSFKLVQDWTTTNSATTSHHSIKENGLHEQFDNPPKDRFHLVYIIMVIHGAAILVPWNMFINAKDYFENYKLDAGNRSSVALFDYKTNFISYIGMASQYPSFLMNVTNLFVQCKGNTLGIRIITGISITIVMFVFTEILALIDTSSWPESFFWITVASAIIINGASGIYQNSTYGMAGVLPMKYTNATILGNNISGSVVAIINIIVLLFSPSKVTAAIYCFAVAIIVLLLAMGAYFLTGHCKFYRYYQNLSEQRNDEFNKNVDRAENSYKDFLSSFGKVFKQIYHLLFGIWFTFFITLALFPAVMSDVKPLTVELSVEYWITIFCFLFFNVISTMGNLLTGFVRWPNARWINILVVLRVCFIPLMILGNFRPALRTVPVYLPYDSVFIVSVILFSLSNGYCSSLVMMYAPKCVPPNESSTAGMMMAIFLVLGVLSGVNFSRIWGVVVGSG